MSRPRANPRYGRIAGRSRPAYTLLEVLLATAIGVVLLAAVYKALEIHLHLAQVGREKIEQATLARALQARIGEDIALSLGTIDPARYHSSGGQQGGQSGGQAGGQSGGSTAPSSGATQGGANPSGGGSTPAPTTTVTADTSSAVVFNQGLIGDSTTTTLTLYVSRVPRELNALRAGLDNPENPAAFSDLRRITYWLAGSPDAPLGLARYEVKVATSADALGPLRPEVNDESPFVIAEEVRALSFSYFDGTDWQESWDGSTAASGSNVPLGPPRAIAIEMKIAPPSAGGRAADETSWKTYRHVIAIPVANGPAQQGSVTP